MATNLVRQRLFEECETSTAQYPMSSDTENEDAPPISVNVGATAKFEVKKNVTQNVPEDVTRATSGAWLDLISPLTHWAGLRGDQLEHKRQLLRIQQGETLVRVGQSAHRRLKELGVDPKPIPTKALIPILEKASLEDADSMLIQTWGNLLASASVHYDVEVITFASILSEIGPRERMIIEKMLGPSGPGRWKDRTMRLTQNIEKTLNKQGEQLHRLLDEAIDTNDHAVFEHLKAFMPDGYPVLVTDIERHLSPMGKDAEPKGDIENPFYAENIMGFTILERQRLIDRGHYVGMFSYSETNPLVISISWSRFTTLGYAFVARVAARDGENAVI